MFKEGPSKDTLRFNKDIPQMILKNLLENATILDSGWDSFVYKSCDSKYVIKKYRSLPEPLFYHYVDLTNKVSELDIFHTGTVRLGKFRL
jgi:hypothetical protein